MLKLCMLVKITADNIWKYFSYFFSENRVDISYFQGKILSEVFWNIYLGPVVQSIVSLTSLLRVILLTVLADSIHNVLIFFAEKM